MTDNEIIKALECCSNRKMDCDNCPYSQAELADNESCAERMEEDAITIIKELTEENERLQDEADRYKRYYFNHEYDKFEAEVRADTVRKMQEKLTKEFDRLHKNNFMTPEVRQWIIDQIAKEMLTEIDK